MNPPLLKMLPPMMPAAIACLLLSACNATRVITVPVTQPRQLAESVQAYVYVPASNGQRIKSANRTTLYEGEWVLSDPGK